MPAQGLALTPAPHSIDATTVDATRRASKPAKMTSSASAAGAGDDLRVMSFNLRVPFILDANNHWGFRKQNVINTIEKARPDLMGIQECVAEQADYLREQLPQYGFRGVGRGNGHRQSEFAPVMYRRDKFKEIDHGYFWLSETPDVPGSKSWGAWSTRMCTWVKLQPLDGSAPFAIFNAHLDNMSGRSRENSARLMHDRIVELASGMGVIVTGDFNADAGTTPYQLLLAGEQLGVPQLLFDAFRIANPKVQSDEGTRHDFNGKRGGNRIDWILCNTAFTPVSCVINRSRSLLGYPSDHYPVQAVLRPTTPGSSKVARIE
jgi:endonuclease/exonuclease/phosphatase family metal-dependent hydrolase